MSFFDALLGKKGSKPRKAGASERRGNESTLYVSASDAGWSAALADSASAILWQKEAWSAVAPSEAEPAYQLNQAIGQLEDAQPQANVVRVVLTIDDPDLHIVDHRFAKLTNFEPRALKEFGAQQAGGRPVAFNSLPLGMSSAREIERRVLSFLPEDRLQRLFFPLGKIATALVSVVPGVSRSLFAETTAGIFASLRVHGYFSTLTIANSENGLVAVRHLPFGALGFAEAYAGAHGLSLEEGVNALNARARLPAPASVTGDVPPEHQTATFAALAPALRELTADIVTSFDYFRYERLAGRPAHLSLTFTGPVIAGFEAWLSESLHMPVDPAADTAALAVVSQAPVLNLLEQSRPGLLKMGNQPYEFSRGHFVAMKVKGAQAQMSTKPKSKLASQMMTQFNAQFPSFAKYLTARESAGISLSREQMLVGGGAFGVLALLVALNIGFLTGPAEGKMSQNLQDYTGLAREAVARAGASAVPPDSGPRGKPALWTENLYAVSKALLPGMKLLRIRLGAGTGRGAENAPTLLITGALPAKSATNLKLVAVFIDRLSHDEYFARQFGQVRFAGAGENNDRTKEEMVFNVSATAAGAKP